MLDKLNNLLFAFEPLYSLLIVIAIMTVIAFIAVMSKHLTVDGAIVSMIFGATVLWAIKVKGFLLFVLYFILSNLAGHFLKHENSIEKKGSQRDGIQVMANGFWPFLGAVLFFITSKEKYLVVFATAISSSFSDTMAGDFGRLSKRSPVSIRTLKPVDKGTSGGVSLLGLASALVSSLLISVFYSLLFGFSLNTTLVITFGGFAGCLADSYLGATCQVMYRDNLTGKITEKSHDIEGKQNTLVRGIKWIDNDTVNFLSNTFASILALTLSLT